MTKISLLAAALAIVAVPACKKKDADAPKTETPPMTGSGSAAVAPKPVDKPVEAPKPKTAQELVDMYKTCGEDLNGGKYDDFMKNCVDDSYVGHEMGKEVKKGDFKAMFESMKTAFPDMKFTPQLAIVNGHDIFGVALTTGTHEGTMKMPPMADTPATHKKFGTLFAHHLKVNDAGKVTEEWAFEDPGTMMAQLGLAPKGSPAKRPVADKGIEGAPIVAIAADDAKEKANLETVKKSNDAFNAHKPADLLATLADDAVESDQAAPKDNKGKKEIEGGLKDFLTAFSDAKINAQTWAAGDYVVTQGTFEGTNDHDSKMGKKTGKHVSVPFVEISQLKDGKITHLWRFYSSFDFAMQLGMMPPPGAAPAGGDAAKPGDKKDEKPADKKDDKKPAPPAKK